MEDRELLVRIDERLQKLTEAGGDLAEIKARLKAINGNCVEHSSRINQSANRITKAETKVAVLWVLFLSFLAAVGTAIVGLWPG